MTIQEFLKKAKVNDEYFPLFENGKLLDVIFDKKTKQYEIKILVENNLPLKVYKNLKNQLEKALNSKVVVTIETNSKNYNSKEIKEYIDDFLETYFKNRQDVSFIIEQMPSVYEKDLKYTYNSVLKENLIDKISPLINKFLQVVGYNLKVKFVFVEEENISFDYDEDLKIFLELKKNNPPKTEKTSTSTTKEPFRYKNTTSYRNPKNKLYESVELDKIENDFVDIRLQGKIFKIEDDGFNKKRFKLFITNYKNSYICNLFVNKKYDASYIQKLENNWVELTGSISYNQFEKENVITVDDIEIIDSKDEELFDAAKLKRVELHTHTNMSAMDGVSSASSLVTLAGKLGHKAIAITDHNVVQAFPDAQKAQKSLKKSSNIDIKVIYGVEMNMVPSFLDNIKNPSNINLKDATYVAFDLETTGLSCRFDKIIEFGAVRFKNGQEEESIDILINPGFKLSATTKNLTHISDEMLQDKNTIDKEISRIKEFIKDSILIAHNATFDIGFLEEAFHEKISNPIIDTLPLSRYLYKDAKQYKLGAIARIENITYDEESAHRGDYDAKILKDVFEAMLNKISNNNLASTHQDLANLQSHEVTKKTKPYHTNLLVKNQKGLKNLFKLISVANTKYFFNTSLVPREEIINYREGLIVGSSCARGEIFEIASTKSEEELLKVMDFYDYIEIQPLDQYQILVDTEKVESLDRVVDIIKAIIAAAKKLNKIIVATGDVHYAYKSEAIGREVLISRPAIGGGYHPLFDYQKRINHYPIQNLKTTTEMLECFPYLTEEECYEYVVLNTNKINDMIEYVYPVHDRLYPPKLENSDEDLTRICYETAHKMYGKELPLIVKERLEKELDAIIKNGFSVIYIIASKTVKKSNEDGFLVGSRGSVGSSFVATCAGITEVNPLKPHYRCPNCGYSDFSIDETKVKSGYDLEDKECPVCHSMLKGDGHNIPFETFLGFNCDKVPDIDLNFSSKNQASAHNYIRELFGKDNVFRAGTISGAAEKTAFGYVKGYFEDKMKTANKAEITRIAKMIEGVKRTTGQHPGGLIVIPSYMDVYDFTPIQFPADDINSDWLTTHFDFNSIHDNVLKLDMLGHVDPTALRMLQNLTGIDPKTIPMNDPKVLSLFNGNDSILDSKNISAIGLPEFGTSLARRMLQETSPKNFSELIQICGLAHGTDVWFGNARELIKNETCKLMDVIGCRDDIMVTMLEYGLEPLDAFNIMEYVRKAKTTLTEEQAKIMKEHNVPDWYIDSCRKIVYMFPKAHAVAYTMMSIRVAYFKYYYPLEYYATYFSTRVDQFDIEAMSSGINMIKSRYFDIQNKKNNKEKLTTKEAALEGFYEVAIEMYNRKIKFTNIDLEKSMDEDFIVDKENNAIIPPFIAIDGLGNAAATSIVEARKQAPFVSKEDLQKRTKLNSTNIKNLEKLGVLKSLNEMDQLDIFLI